MGERLDYPSVSHISSVAQVHFSQIRNEDLHIEVGAMEEASVGGDAPLDDTIDLTDSPGPSRCA